MTGIAISDKTVLRAPSHPEYAEAVLLNRFGNCSYQDPVLDRLTGIFKTVTWGSLENQTLLFSVPFTFLICHTIAKKQISPISFLGPERVF